MSPLVNYSKILSRLYALRRRIVLLRLGSGALASIAYLAGGFLVAAGLSMAGIAPVGVRLTWWLAVFAGLIFILGPIVWRYLLFPPSPEKLALLVEADHPQLKNRLIAALQLKQFLTANAEGYSTDLVGRTVVQADRLCGQIDLTASADPAPVRFWAKRAGILILFAVTTVFIFPGAVNRAFSSFSQPLTTIDEPVSYTLDVYPGNADIVKFDTLLVRAVVRGADLPKRIEFAQRAEGGSWLSENISGLVFTSSASPLGPDSLVFSARIGPLLRDVEYMFSTDELVSPTFTVVALDRPRITGIRQAYFYPPYTGLEPVVIDENDGAISALTGTDVELTVRANKRLAAAQIVFDDGTTIEMDLRDRSATGQFKIERDASYHVRLVDDRGYENPHPIEYPISRQDDAYPRVEILMPGHDADLDEEMAENLKIAAVDDFGFDHLSLIYRWISGGQLREEKRISLELPRGSSNTVEVDYWWDLELIGMMPSDLVSYHVEIADNDRVTGPKISISNTYTLRLPSLDEMIAEIDDRQDENLQSLEEILRGQQKLAEELERLHREMMTAEDIDWQTQKQLENTSAEQQDLADRFNEAAKEFSDNAAALQEKKLASAEMLAKLAEAQQLFEEVATDEMREAAKQLREAMEELDMTEMADALEEMQLSTEEMIKRLERTIAYLKKMQAEQKVDQMIKRAEDLLNQQNNLNERVDSTDENKLAPLADREKAIKDEFDKFADELAALEPMLNDARLAPPSLNEQFCKLGKQSQAPQQMSQAAQAMQNQKKEGSQKSGGQAAESLKSMVNEMRNMQSMMNSKMQDEVAEMLRKALDQALYLSEHQEEVRELAAGLDQQSPALRELAEQQADLLSGAQRLESAIQEIAKKSMCVGGKAGSGLGAVLGEMGLAAEMLTQQNGRGASTPQRNAMSGLNQTAGLLMQGMDKNTGQCQNPGMCDKPGGMMPRMESLSNRQGRLNSQMAQMPELGSGGMTIEEKMALSRLKGEQQAVRKGVEELQKEFGDRRNVLGRLDKLASEMKKVIEDLERNAPTRQTRTRMRRIYSRMLDFQHSLHRQDYKEDRRARFGNDILRDSPADIDLDAVFSNDQWSRLLESYLDEGYPKAYESLIKSYYRELLEEQRLQSSPVK